MEDRRAEYPRSAQQLQAGDDVPVNPSTAPTLGDLFQRRISRRSLLKQALGIAAGGALVSDVVAGVTPDAAGVPMDAEDSPPARFTFSEIAHGADATHHVAPGYRADVLVRWGDPVTRDAPAFDPGAQSAAAQRGQFGYNNDFIGYVPLPLGSENSGHGLLCVNHEYTTDELMLPRSARYRRNFAGLTRETVDTEMAAHGGSIIEIRKQQGRWRVVEDSRYARRISALDTEMRFSGPAAGHRRLRTSDDPGGTRVIGTLNNCAGGITPWGTYLMAEENFHAYFVGSRDGNPEEANYKRYGVPGRRFGWGRYHRRFDIDREPNAANRYGWIVEVDPLDPSSTPVKRTALGRFKHEGAEIIVNQDGRLVIYSGDDQRFEYLYRFVSEGTVDRRNPAANRNLLDHGELSVARFDDDGTMQWLPLVHGRGGLDSRNGFDSQADVLIETRRAATLLQATPMDRPEDVQPNPLNGRVYVMLTNNAKRSVEQIDAANPRAANLWGHILELAPPDGDHAANHARWEILLRAGNPGNPLTGASWNPATSENGWFACPDNCAVDPGGGLWVCTDQGSSWKRKSGTADGVWAVETEGAGRGTGRMFFRVPIGAEMCGPRFTPDGKTLFLAVQHPADVGSSTFENPATRWPDFVAGMPPRPSVVVVSKDDGGVIGG